MSPDVRHTEGEGERRECWAKYRQQWVESSGAEDRAQERPGAAASPSFLLQSVARCGRGHSSETLHLSVSTDTTHHTPHSLNLRGSDQCVKNYISASIFFVKIHTYIGWKVPSMNENAQIIHV